MYREIGVGGYVIIKDGGVDDYKQDEHTKKVKDRERAVKMRKKKFGRDSVGNPVDQPDSKHLIKGKYLGGAETEIDKKEFIKAAAKDDATIKIASDALKKAKRK